MLRSTEALGANESKPLSLGSPNGVQEELSEAVAVLLNEGADVLALGHQAGFRCFVSVEQFKTLRDDRGEVVRGI